VDELTRDRFVRYLRDALKHLHDLEYLRQSPLAALLAVDGRFDVSIALQDILTRAIASLEPTASEPLRARALTVYECLYYLYVQRFSQQEVADQLGMSARQLRRELLGAVEKLACLLSEQYDLDAVQGATEQARAGADAYSDLEWLKDIPQTQPADPDLLLSEVLHLAQPLAAKYGVQIEGAAAQALPALAVHPVALNQILLGLLSVAIHRASGGQVRVSARQVGWEIEIQVTVSAAPAPAGPAWDKEEANIGMARQLARLCGGRLVLNEAPGAFGVTLIVPALEQSQVLVIEDHADTLQLFQRYALGTRYRLTGVRDPQQALDLATQLDPQIIVLDVMMPEVDGWKVLSRLRQYPATSDIPIVVCTILPQEELALSLGANAFVRKPVSRQAFLAALDSQITLARSGCD
jgi:CheY-like chemotaxis protein/predicted DNA-binding protein (UPF0251 family)